MLRIDRSWCPEQNAWEECVAGLRYGLALTRVHLSYSLHGSMADLEAESHSLNALHRDISLVTLFSSTPYLCIAFVFLFW